MMHARWSGTGTGSHVGRALLSREVISKGAYLMIFVRCCDYLLYNH